MYGLIATIFLLIGLSGMGVIVFRKIPLLADLPISEKIFQESLPSKAIRKFREFDPCEIFNFRNLLKKFLLKFRILTLKIENKTSALLENIRQKERSKDNSLFGSADNYWQELRENAKEVKQKTRKRKKVSK